MPVSAFHLERVGTPTGPFLIVTDDEGRLRAAEWEDLGDAPRREIRGRLDRSRPSRDLAHRMHRSLRVPYGERVELRPIAAPSAAARALEAYFEGELEAVGVLPTSTNGTEFQRAVWDALRRIPVGQTMSYSGVALAIGRPTATRAVGLANGSNPIPIFVPCHRVIGANGSLTGFGGGIHRKRWLLAHERALVDEQHSLLVGAR